MTDAPLKIHGLKFSYSTVPVLCGIDFELESGALTMLLGKNGAGKSTLLDCVLGNIKPSEGDIIVCGKPLSRYKCAELAKKISFVPQKAGTSFNYTVLEMTALGRISWLSYFSNLSARDYDAAERELCKLGIDHLKHKGFSELSGGEQRLCLIARALTQETDILIMDEPVSDLDLGNKLMILEHIKLLSQQGKSVLLSTHDPAAALRFANKVVAISNGIIAANGTPHEVITDELMLRLYGVKADVLNAI